ncbi:acyl carrier protein [Minwuia sp.]|uniref:acyl carrier protein n=1 Tax=Minwuia sp. TaxID=2493630 RepID=UPI003A8FBB56
MDANEWMQHVVAAVAEETETPASEISADSTAADVPGWDSLAHVRIMLNIEARAGQPVDIDASYTVATVGELVALLAGTGS